MVSHWKKNVNVLSFASVTRLKVVRHNHTIPEYNSLILKSPGQMIMSGKVGVKSSEPSRITTSPLRIEKKTVDTYLT